MVKKSPFLSVVIPVYNEESNISWFYEEITELLTRQKDIRYEIIYINDGSTDNTATILEDLSSKHSNVIYICLARNFGKEAATSAGIHVAKGNAIAIIDGDGQHPPATLIEMLARWRNGAQQVVGIRTGNKKAGLVKTLGSKLFYAIARRLGASSVIANATDFRLIDRELADVFALYGEKKRMTRALLDWSGYQTEYVPFEARDREHGVASYNFKSLLKLALNSYVGATLKPLYLVGFIGAAITSLTLVAFVILAINQFILGDVLGLGVTTGALVTLFATMLVGILMISQGIVAVYVANIHLEAQNRPLYIINKAKSKLHTND